MSFKAQLAQDAINCFLNANEFAETITYTPSGGSPKSIKAVVERSLIEPGSEDHGRILQNQLEIYVANDETYGVTSINKNGDEVSLPKIEGGTAVSWAVVSVLSKDEGMWHLLIQK